jgi:hypothetical protein
MSALVTTHRFRAIWPVVDEGISHGVLIGEALEDLPAVALRHGVRLIKNTAAVRVCEGRLVPGSGGARLVVVADVACVRLVDIPEDDVDERKDANDTGMCGTNAGYLRHNRAHQRACGPCLAAHNDYKAAWKLRQREAS